MQQVHAAARPLVRCPEISTPGCTAHARASPRRKDSPHRRQRARRHMVSVSFCASLPSSRCTASCSCSASAVSCGKHRLASASQTYDDSPCATTFRKRCDVVANRPTWAKSSCTRRAASTSSGRSGSSVRGEAVSEGTRPSSPLAKFQNNLIRLEKNMNDNIGLNNKKVWPTERRRNLSFGGFETKTKTEIINELSRPQKHLMSE